MALQNEFFAGTAGGNTSPTVLATARSTTAGGPYMAQLGTYQFSLDTAAFDTLQRQTAYRWQAQQRIGRAPAMQFLGAGEDTVELNGTIYPHFRGGLGQLALMRAAASNGEPLPLTYAFETAGQYAGLWCIQSVRDNRSVFFRDGAARKIEFSLTLAAYGEDAGGQAGLVTLATAANTVAGALLPPAMTGASAAVLKANAVAVDVLPSITATSPVSDVQRAAAAVTEATRGAAIISGLKSAALQRGLAAVITGQVPSLKNVVGDVIRVAQTHDVINRDTLAAIKLVATSRGDVQAIARSAEILLRQSRQDATASTGRIESAAQTSTGDVVADAAVGNAARAGSSIAYAAGEASRQLSAIAAKIFP
jgi:phage protein U